MKRKVSAILLTLAMVISLTAGCANKSNDISTNASEESGDKKITVWAWDDKFNVAVMEEAAKFYKDIDPDAQIEVVSLSKEDVYVKLQTALAGDGSGLPDIVLLEDYVSGKYLNTFGSRFADLTNEIDYSNFLDFKTEAVTKDGKVYAVPFDTGATALYYRIDLIEQAGYTEGDMKDLTWSEFIQIGKDVTEKTGVQMIVEIANNKTTLVRSMMQSAGMWYFDENGDISIKDNESLKESFRIIKEMKDAGILYEVESTENRAAALNNGTVASVVNAPWFVSALRGAEDQSGLWRATTIPRMEKISESINASNVGGSSWYVLEKSDVKEDAINFLKEIYDGNLDFYKNILNNQGAICAYLPAFELEEFEQGDEFFGGQQVNKLFAETLPKVQAVYYGGYVSEANDAITTALSGVFDGSLTIDEALEEAQNQLANQLGK